MPFRGWAYIEKDLEDEEGDDWITQEELDWDALLKWMTVWPRA